MTDPITFGKISFFLFIVLISIIIILMRPYNLPIKNRVEKIFEELKNINLIEESRNLELLSGKIEFFGAGIFKKVIYYTSNSLELNRTTIQFSLLHEEGHIKVGYFGTLLSNIISYFGGGLILLGILWGLFYYLLFSSLYFNLEICLLMIIVGVVIEIFYVKLLKKFLQADEYASDRWAAEKIRDELKNDKPSLVLEQALTEIAKIIDKKDGRKGFIYSMKIFLRYYHPSNSQRVTNVALHVDKK